MNDTNQHDWAIARDRLTGMYAGIGMKRSRDGAFVGEGVA